MKEKKTDKQSIEGYTHKGRGIYVDKDGNAYRPSVVRSESGTPDMVSITKPKSGE
jgi:hypothetical protein